MRNQFVRNNNAIKMKQKILKNQGGNIHTDEAVDGECLKLVDR